MAMSFRCARPGAPSNGASFRARSTSVGAARTAARTLRTPHRARGKLSVLAMAAADPKTAMKMDMDPKAALKAKLDEGASRAVVTDLLLELEATNPTPAPTKSELLVGTWEFAYNGGIAPGPVPSPTRPIALAMYAGGFSPGSFGLAVASMLPKDLIKTSEFKLSIKGGEPLSSTASISIEALGRKVPVMISTEIVVESDRRMTETYKSVKVDGNATEVPASLQYERTLFISYLDEDLMIARDETGTADVLFRIGEEEAEPIKEEPAPVKEDPVDAAVEAIKNVAEDVADVVESVAAVVEEEGKRLVEGEAEEEATTAEAEGEDKEENEVEEDKTESEEEDKDEKLK